MVFLRFVLPPLPSQPRRECFPASSPSEQQPSEKAELPQGRKALTAHRGREGDYCSPLRRGRARVGIMRPEPRAGPSACGCIFSPKGQLGAGGAALGGAAGTPEPPGHGDTWRGAAALPCRVSSGRGGRGKDAVPIPVGALRTGEGCCPQTKPCGSSAELAVLLRVAPRFKDASSLSFFPTFAVKLPLTCISYQT